MVSVRQAATTCTAYDAQQHPTCGGMKVSTIPSLTFIPVQGSAPTQRQRPEDDASMTAVTMQPRKRLPTPPTAKRHRGGHLRLFLIATSFLALFLLYIPPAYLPHLPSLFNLRKLCRRALRWYQRVLHVHPLESRAVTAGIIFLIADFLAQILQVPPGKPACALFSGARLARYSLYGLFIMGPFLYVWYAMMNTYGAEDDFRGSLLKCAFEQITLEPICISMYMIYDAIVCRRGLQSFNTSLRTNFLPLWFKNAIFWLPANFANYYIGTPDLRVVFANLCSLFWNIYFSGKVNRISPASFPEKRYLNHDRQGAKPDFRKSASEHLEALAIHV